jgi:transposase
MSPGNHGEPHGLPRPQRAGARMKFETVRSVIDGVPFITAERALGDDMSRFPTASHVASWTGICPGHHESAGKRKSGKTRKGNRWLRATLIDPLRAGARPHQRYRFSRNR